jgi:hypothetical protein
MYMYSMDRKGWLAGCNHGGLVACMLALHGAAVQHNLVGCTGSSMCWRSQASAATCPCNMYLLATPLVHVEFRAGSYTGLSSAATQSTQNHIMTGEWLHVYVRIVTSRCMLIVQTTTVQLDPQGAGMESGNLSGADHSCKTRGEDTAAAASPLPCQSTTSAMAKWMDDSNGTQHSAHAWLCGLPLNHGSCPHQVTAAPRPACTLRPWPEPPHTTFISVQCAPGVHQHILQPARSQTCLVHLSTPSACRILHGETSWLIVWWVHAPSECSDTAAP